ncbi:hypothetical protein MKX03_028848 [Papaver bracteatum]|nr:hypothetical protein MKX03_028848 [Papaver bracteatum]
MSLLLLSRLRYFSHYRLSVVEFLLFRPRFLNTNTSSCSSHDQLILNKLNSKNREQPQDLNRHVDDFCSKFVSSDIYDNNSMISGLGRDGKFQEARNVFDKMPYKDNVSYASMITVYLKNGDLRNAEKIFKIVPEAEASVVVNSAMIDAYAKACRMEEACRIFDEMPERNVYSWTSLLSGYIRIGQIDEARRLFDQMPDKSAVTWTTMILGYARSGLIMVSRELFDQMPEKNVVAWTSIVKSYVENKQIDEAGKLFDRMPFRNLYSWNIMISGYLDNKRVDEAIELFRVMMPQSNAVTWTSMVTGLARNGLIKAAREYFDQMPKKDVAAWNAMITAYTDAGLMIEANELFNLMPEKNAVSWNAVITGYARNGPGYEALKHLALMLHTCYRPNDITITSALTACESMQELMQVHALVILLGFDSETSISNAFVTMYSRSGDLGAAEDVFKALQDKDVVSWTAMILPYSNHGYGKYALQVFACMLRSGTKPNHITFVGVLSACSHAGFIEKGRRIFYSMRNGYGLEPKAEHYSCLVDLLGRAGHINEAVKVVNKMPPEKKDGALIGTLLGACNLHGNVDVANQLEEKLLEMDPTGSGGYVLLANLYAGQGKWDDLARVRKKMKDKQVRKVAGFSQITVKDKTYAFFVGGNSHPQVKEIYAMLSETLLPPMKDIAYLHNNPFILV